MLDFQYILPNNFIYLYHTDEYFIIPIYPESIGDNLSSSFASTTALSRTAPTFTYSNSGPRSVSVSLKFHRDMLNDINKKGSNVKFDNQGNIVTSITDDYVDILIKKLQAVALPAYKSSGQSVVPPQIAIRFGNDIFIKGVVNSGIQLTYSLPLLANNKYAIVDIGFNVYETQPYDAKTIGDLGSFRGLTTSLVNKMRG